jgi:hypothetical protein
MTNEHPMTAAAEKIRTQAVQICLNALGELSRKQESALRRNMIREANIYSEESALVRSLAEKIAQLPIPIPTDNTPELPHLEEPDGE